MTLQRRHWERARRGDRLIAAPYGGFCTSNVECPSALPRGGSPPTTAWPSSAQRDARVLDATPARSCPPADRCSRSRCCGRAFPPRARAPAPESGGRTPAPRGEPIHEPRPRRVRGRAVRVHPDRRAGEEEVRGCVGPRGSRADSPRYRPPVGRWRSIGSSSRHWSWCRRTASDRSAGGCRTRRRTCSYPCARLRPGRRMALAAREPRKPTRQMLPALSPSSCVFQTLPLSAPAYRMPGFTGLIRRAMDDVAEQLGLRLCLRDSRRPCGAPTARAV